MTLSIFLTRFLIRLLNEASLVNVDPYGNVRPPYISLGTRHGNFYRVISLIISANHGQVVDGQVTLTS